jgi:hypothetical protein
MRTLVIAAEPVEPDQLADAIGDDLGDDEIRVVTPALNDSRLAFWVSDPDDAIAEAESASDETVGRLREEGLDAEGETGESDPVLALEDALATFPADRVVIFRHPEGEEAYLEDDVIDEARERLGVPIVAAEVSR